MTNEKGIPKQDLPSADVHIRRSAGRAKDGMPVFYVRPAQSCENRSRRFLGYDQRDKGIIKWFVPNVNYYLVDGHLIGSNTAQNALKEYWRICDRDKIFKQFEATTFSI
jgi:hypothetical protein